MLLGILLSLQLNQRHFLYVVAYPVRMLHVVVAALSN